ncbi:MAG TPA: hypothetical protein VMT99_00600 [Candidatus Paceibacterota bacterium]|nr:hypothetical protein [Candidatus Paceibacterota bacterium]
MDRECIEVVTDGENALFVPGSDINQALCLFYKRKIPGWINYRDDYVTRGICKRGEFYAQVDAEKPEPSGQHAAV